MVLTRKEISARWRKAHREQANASARQWYRKQHPKKERLRQRKLHLKAFYGISFEDFQALINEQDGACKICHTSFNSLPSSHATVDPDHVTGVVRAILCKHCNTGLGHFKDSPQLLQAAASYLKVTR